MSLGANAQRPVSYTRSSDTTIVIKRKVYRNVDAQTAHYVNLNADTAKIEKQKHRTVDGDINVYIGAKGGISMSSSSLDGGKMQYNPIAGGFVGLRYNAFRVQLDGTWTEAHPAIRGTIYADLTKTKLRPFIGVGGGAAKQTTGVKVTKEDNPIPGIFLDKSFSFTWHVRAGVSYNVVDHVNISLEAEVAGLPQQSKFLKNLPEQCQNFQSNVEERVRMETDKALQGNIWLSVSYSF